MEKYLFFEHTADMKFQAFGKTPEKCFSNAGYALIAIITKDKVKPTIKKKIKVKGKDIENLLYNFLEEFLFLIDSSNFLLSKIEKIKIELKSSADAEDHKKFELTAIVSGDNVKKYKTITDIKAITYNNMFFKKEKEKYICQVVIDVWSYTTKIYKEEVFKQSMINPLNLRVEQLVEFAEDHEKIGERKTFIYSKELIRLINNGGWISEMNIPEGNHYCHIVEYEGHTFIAATKDKYDFHSN